MLGTAESIRAMAAAAMQDYFNRRYRSENIVLAATGNVDFDGLVAQVEKQSASWNERPTADTPKPDDETRLPEGISLDRTLEIADAHQAYLVRISPGPDMKSEDRYAVKILASILGDEGGSRLFWELIDTGRAEVATVWPHEFLDTGAWFTYMVCAPEDTASNRTFIQQIMKQIVEAGVEPDELSQAINKATAGCIMQSERPSNRLFGLGSRWLSCGEYISTDDTLEKLRGLDVQAVSAAAKRYLTGDEAEIIATAGESPVMS